MAAKKKAKNAKHLRGGKKLEAQKSLTVHHAPIVITKPTDTTST